MQSSPSAGAARASARSTGFAFLALAALGACSTNTGYAPSPAPARSGTPTAADTSRPAPAPGGIRRWATGDNRFVVVQADTLLLLYPQGTQSQVIHRQASLQVQLRDQSGGGMQLTVRLDSLRSIEIPRDSLVLGDGLLWTGDVDSLGRVATLQPLRPVPLVEQLLRPALAALLFPLPADGLREGRTWRDSTGAQRKLLTIDVTEHAVTDYVAGEASGGVSVTATGSLTAAGSGPAFGQTLELAATGQRRQYYTVKSAGKLESASGRDSLAVEVSIPAVGQTVPATRIATFQIGPK